MKESLVEEMREASPEFFTQISSRYDITNRWMTWGLDTLWRGYLVQQLPASLSSLLDIACGTGDVSFLVAKKRSQARIVGVDLSKGMLHFAKKRLQKEKIKNLSFVYGDARSLPFEENSFEAATMSFGIRNVKEYQKALADIHRILKPGGNLFIMEFGVPQNILLKYGYLFYLRFFMPLIGFLLTRHINPYRYLGKTIEKFPNSEEFIKKCEEVGLLQKKIHLLMGGSVIIYHVTKS